MVNSPASTCAWCNTLEDAFTFQIQDRYRPGATQEIIHAWVHLLRETRYPTENEFISGNDGSTFEFYAWWDRMSGRGQSLMGWTWSPASGPTKMLVDLGQGLIAYAKASPKDRQALLAKCMDLAKAIQAYEYK